jgi:hypothetical protein
LQDVIHQPHESCWGTHQNKWHVQPLENTFFTLESSLPYISIFYGDLVVVKLQINITKVLGLLELVEKVVYSGNWVSILNCDFAQISIINTEFPGLVFLLYEHDWASAGTGAWLNVPFLEKLLNLSLDFLIFKEIVLMHWHIRKSITKGHFN